MTRRGAWALCALVCLSLAACTGIPEGLSPVREFDVGRYGGDWFEIARLDHRFERGLSNVSASYALRADGGIDVVNRGFDPAKCAWREAKGRAVFQGPRDVASLSVTFFWPFAGGYHVIALDRENYGWALVAGPSRGYLWILARRPDLDPAIRERLVREANALGFPTDALIRVSHEAPRCDS